MTINEEKRELFTVPQGYYLAHCISGDYTLGAGIAKQFDVNYNMKFKLKKQFEIPIDQMRNTYIYDKYVGNALLVDNVFNLVTKARCYHSPTYEDLESALIDMKEKMEMLDVTKLAIPQLSCGLDRLEWSKVKELIEDVFEDTDVEILVCIL